MKRFWRVGEPLPMGSSESTINRDQSANHGMFRRFSWRLYILVDGVSDYSLTIDSWARMEVNLRLVRASFMGLSKLLWNPGSGLSGFIEPPRRRETRRTCRHSRWRGAGGGKSSKEADRDTRDETSADPEIKNSLGPRHDLDESAADRSAWLWTGNVGSNHERPGGTGAKRPLRAISQGLQNRLHHSQN